MRSVSFLKTSLVLLFLVSFLISFAAPFSFTLNEDGTLKGEGYDFDTRYKNINISENLILLGKLDLTQADSGSVVDLKSGVNDSLKFQTTEGKIMLSFDTKEGVSGVRIKHGATVEQRLPMGTALSVIGSEDSGSDIFVVQKGPTVGTFLRSQKMELWRYQTKVFKSNFMI